MHSVSVHLVIEKRSLIISLQKYQNRTINVYFTFLQACKITLITYLGV